MNPDIQIAVSNALAAQPWYVRRKDTITAVTGTILQLANVASAYTTDMPEWVSVALAVLIGMCQIVVHAGTPGAITPSMAGRLEKQAPQTDEGIFAVGAESPEIVDVDEDGLAAGAEAHELAGLAMANPHDLGYTPGPDAHGDGSTVYEGAHRAD